jgi:glycosyltransferase involved in cell wall biosynthesis
VRRSRSLSGQSLLSRFRRDGRQQVRSSRRFGRLRKLGSLFLVPDTYVGWYPFAVAEGLRALHEHRFDAIYSTSPPETSHLVARRLHRRSGLPWVADFRDPWMNLHLYPPPTSLHRRLHRRLERGVCDDATVIVTTEWHAGRLRADYPRMHPPLVIPNGYDHQKFEGLDEAFPPEDRFVITHAGMLTQKRSAAPFLEGLRRFLSGRPDARVEVRFVGPRESANDDAVAAHGLGEVVEFRDTVSHPESLRLERTSHILLLVKHSDPLYRGIVPGKLYEYIGAERPILALVPEGEAARIVTELRRGETVPVDDVDAIHRVIAAMYDKYERGALDDAYNLSVVPEFRRRHRTEQLAKTLDDLAARQE